MCKKLHWLLALSPSLFAAIALSAGCGTSSDSAPVGGSAGAAPQPVAQADFVGKLADAVCSNVGNCCTDHGYAFDATQCAVTMKAAAQKLVDDAAIATGVTYDSNAAGDCIARYQAVASSCAADLGATQALQRACGATWVGTRQEGDPCQQSIECAGNVDGSVRCTMSVPTAGDGGVQRLCAQVQSTSHGASAEPCSGTCQSAAGGGETCSASSAAPLGAKHCWVTDGLYCDPVKYQCAPLIAVGQPCTGLSSCADSAYCKAGTCTARIGIGSACEASGTADPCQFGGWCNAGTKSCEAQKGEEESCLSFLECASSRCKGGRCIAESVAASNELCGVK